MFFNYVMTLNTSILDKVFAKGNVEFIRSISLNEIYSFISYCQIELHASAGTRARKIVSIRQFWKFWEV